MHASDLRGWMDVNAVVVVVVDDDDTHRMQEWPFALWHVAHESNVLSGKRTHSFPSFFFPTYIRMYPFTVNVVCYKYY